MQTETPLGSKQHQAHPEGHESQIRFDSAVGKVHNKVLRQVHCQKQEGTRS